jgi:hypothetical protein
MHTTAPPIVPSWFSPGGLQRLRVNEKRPSPWAQSLTVISPLSHMKPWEIYKGYLQIRLLFLFYFLVLGFKLRALCLLGRYSTTWATQSVLLCVLVIFEIQSCLTPGLAWIMILFVLSHVARLTGMQRLPLHNHWLRRGLENFLPRLASNHDPPDLHLSSC